MRVELVVFTAAVAVVFAIVLVIVAVPVAIAIAVVLLVVLALLEVVVWRERVVEGAGWVCGV